MIHEDRRRAGSFGEDAEQYDRARPSYPRELVGDLMVDDPVRVLDVGCGTGKAGRLFAARGCDVLGVEPDNRMAAVARSHGLAVEVATFEDWEPSGRTFDLVVSGQAWHWVDPTAGPVKAGSVLRPGAILGVFWNYVTLDEGMRAALDRVYRREAPALVDNYLLGAMARDSGAGMVALVDASRAFEPATVRSYRWDRRFSREEWLDLVPTQSDHRVLPRAQLDALLVASGRAIDGLGGTVLVHYDTELITARRLAV